MPADHNRNRWELRTCARRAHITYAPDDGALAEQLSGTTGLGEVWRCLRCGEFILGAPQRRGRPEDAPIILRGKALRQAIIVRALAVERWIRAALLGLAETITRKLFLVMVLCPPGRLCACDSGCS